MKFRIMSDCQIGRGKFLKRGGTVELSEGNPEDSKLIGMLAHAGRLGSMDPSINAWAEKSEKSAPRAE